MEKRKRAAAAAALACAAVTGCGVPLSPETPEGSRAAMMERAVLSTGNTARLDRVFRKAANGEDLTFAYIGGSITEGYDAGVQSPKCYASVSAKAFADTYCQGGTVTCLNSGVSGTPSVLGNLRVQRDVLSASPDVIFIEFAVNDGKEQIYKTAYESLVRSCLEAECEPAVVLLFTYMQTGHTCQEQQQEIGAHYDLGMLSVRDTILPEIEAGRMQWDDYSEDGVHPTVQGHALIGDMISAFFAKANEKRPDRSYQIPAETVHAPLWLDAELHDAADTPFHDGDWIPGTNDPHFRAGFVYQPDCENQPLSMQLRGQTLFLVYKKSNDPAWGTAGVYVNGKLACCVCGCGKDGWGGPAVELIETYDAVQDMTVEVKMLDDQTDKQFEIFAIGVSRSWQEEGE